MKFEYRNCGICNSGKTRPLGLRRGPKGDDSRGTNIVKCLSCGFIYPNPLPIFDKNEIQSNFDRPEEYFPRQNDINIAFYDKVLERIEKIIQAKGKILDVGAGRGEFLYAAKKRNWDTLGTDVSRAFVDFAKKNYSVNIIQGDLKDLNLEAKAFDAATLISVIQYVPDPMSTLKKIHSSLKENGVLYIEVTNEDALVFKAGDFFETITKGIKMTTRLSPLFPSYQLYGFNKISLTYALETCGFEIYNIEIKGMTGGGRPKNFLGLSGALLNGLRKTIVFAGGLTGRGHLIYCIAKKRKKNDTISKAQPR